MEEEEEGTVVEEEAMAVDDMDLPPTAAAIPPPPLEELVVVVVLVGAVVREDEEAMLMGGSGGGRLPAGTLLGMEAAVGMTGGGGWGCCPLEAEEATETVTAEEDIGGCWAAGGMASWRRTTELLSRSCNDCSFSEKSCSLLVSSSYSCNEDNPTLLKIASSG